MITRDNFDPHAVLELTRRHCSLDGEKINLDTALRLLEEACHVIASERDGAQRGGSQRCGSQRGAARRGGSQRDLPGPIRTSPTYP